MFRENSTDIDVMAERLADGGLSAAACRRKAELFGMTAEVLRADGPARAFFVPGRIELLGKHTDYAGGSSIVAAVERGFCLKARATDGPKIEIVDAAGDERATFEMGPDLSPTIGHWSNYPMTVARRLARNFPEARSGARIAFAGDLPPAAGMSSSSALMVAVALAIIEVNRLAETEPFKQNIHNRLDLAGYLATIENGCSFGTLTGDRGVGTFGGSEDHTAILTSRAGMLNQYAYCPVRHQREIAMPEGYTLAIGSTGVAAEKTGRAMAKYNDASRLVCEITELWCRKTGRDDAHPAAAVASAPDAVDRLRMLVGTADDGPMGRRLEHFLAENFDILPAAGDALAAGDLASFGRLVDRSQQAAEELLGNQIPETSHLARSARANGAVAASAFGAGFGGSVWAMVESTRCEAFLADWSGTYHEQFPQHAAQSVFFQTAPGPAAFELM